MEERAARTGQVINLNSAFFCLPAGVHFTKSMVTDKVFPSDNRHRENAL